jgi:hypothetical protein
LLLCQYWLVRTTGESALLRTFIIGTLLGVAIAAGALYAYPVVDQHRELSIISVLPNGGNTESFHINVPTDRIMIGAPGQPEPLPAGLLWPEDEILANVRTELFKIRNSRDKVVGVAARNAAKDGVTDLLDWVLHLPARGSVFVNMSPDAMQGGYRIGRFRAGTREFAPLTGTMTESWIVDTTGEEDAPDGRIELFLRFVNDEEPTR